MTCFILSRKDQFETKVLGLYKSLDKAEEIVKSYISNFNRLNPENQIYIRSEFDYPQRNVINENEIIYCKTIWYRTKASDLQVILKIEEFQVE